MNITKTVLNLDLLQCITKLIQGSMRTCHNKAAEMGIEWPPLTRATQEKIIGASYDVALTHLLFQLKSTFSDSL